MTISTRYNIGDTLYAARQTRPGVYEPVKFTVEAIATYTAHGKYSADYIQNLESPTMHDESMCFTTKEACTTICSMYNSDTLDINQGE